MPAKQTILTLNDCPNSEFLEAALALLQVRGQLSRTQATTIQRVCAQHLPAPLKIEQRMPKSVTDVTIREYTYKIGTRAEVKLLTV
jgi:hypothetical protein